MYARFGRVSVRDLWEKKDIGVFTGRFVAQNLPQHGSMMLAVTPRLKHDDGASASASATSAGDCQTPMDCSLAGACSEVTKTCACDSGYTGRFCERLREGKTHLIWPPQAGMPWAAGWGASVRKDPGPGPERWHAWVDVICQANQTGVDQPARYVTCYHTQGTNVVHLTAPEATGPYSFADVSLGAETNNPHAVIRKAGGKDEYLLFHTNDNKPQPDIATCTGVPSPRRDCHFAAPPSTLSSCINSGEERAPAK